MGITEVAELVRAGLEADEDVAIDLERAAKFPERVPDFYGAGGPAAKYLWQRFSAARVLAEVAAKRQLLDQALAWEHVEHEDEWHSCNAHPERIRRWPDEPTDCTCGRDERVLAVLQTLAAPYQETTS